MGWNLTLTSLQSLSLKVVGNDSPGGATEVKIFGTTFGYDQTTSNNFVACFFDFCFEGERLQFLFIMFYLIFLIKVFQSKYVREKTVFCAFRI